MAQLVKMSTAQLEQIKAAALEKIALIDARYERGNVSEKARVHFDMTKSAIQAEIARIDRVIASR